MRRLLVNISLLSVLLSIGCIEKFDFEFDDSLEYLVVDGMVTNEPGPYQIRLSYTSTGQPRFVTGATVSIRDNIGRTFMLNEVQEGLYEHTLFSFTGQVGMSYTLLIETPDGRMYESTPEVMAPVPIIENIDFEFDTRQIVTNIGTVTDITGFEIKIDTETTGDDGTFLMYDYRGVYKIRNIYDTLLLNIDPICTDCQFTCWQEDLPTNFISVFGTETNQVQPITDHFLTFINGNIKFANGYVLEVKQFSLNRNAYDYWNAVQIQTRDAGSIFDPIPFQIRGNMRNVNDPDETVLGYFGAHAVDTRRVGIPREAFPGMVDLGFQQCLDPNFPEFCFDCRLQEGAFEFAPPFWFDFFN